MNKKQAMKDFGFSEEDLKLHTKNYNWYICWAELEVWCERTFDYGNIKEETYKTFSAFARAWDVLMADKTKNITDWTGCNDGGY